METMLRLKSGRKVIAECRASEIDKMSALVTSLKKVYVNDAAYEPTNTSYSEDVTITAFEDMFSELRKSGIATRDKFDIFDSLSVWSHTSPRDGIKVHTAWKRGF